MRRVSLRGLAARKLRLALTALAIVLGVTFVTGTLVLGDTLNRTFDNLVGTAYQHVSFQVRGKAAFNNDSTAAARSIANHSGARATWVPRDVLADAPTTRRTRSLAPRSANFATWSCDATTTLARPRSSRSRNSSGVSSVVAGITTTPSLMQASVSRSHRHSAPPARN